MGWLELTLLLAAAIAVVTVVLRLSPRRMAVDRKETKPVPGNESGRDSANVDPSAKETTSVNYDAGMARSPSNIETDQVSPNSDSLTANSAQATSEASVAQQLLKRVDQESDSIDSMIADSNSPIFGAHLPVDGADSNKLAPAAIAQLSTSPGPPATVFISCAPENEGERNRLEKHLSVFVRGGLINLLHRGHVPPGGDEAAIVQEFISKSSTVVLLISPDYLASEQQWGEMKSSIEMRRSNSSVRVVPVIVSACAWRYELFATEGLKPLPNDSKPISNWSDKDSAWTAVAEGIRTAIAQTDARDEFPTSQPVPSISLKLPRVAGLIRSELPKVLAGCRSSPRPILLRANIDLSIPQADNRLDQWTYICDALASRGIGGVADVVNLVSEVQNAEISPQLAVWAVKLVGAVVGQFSEDDAHDPDLKVVLSNLRRFAELESSRWDRLSKELANAAAVRGARVKLSDPEDYKVRTYLTEIANIWSQVAVILQSPIRGRAQDYLEDALRTPNMTHPPPREDVEMWLAEVRPLVVGGRKDKDIDVQVQSSDLSRLLGRIESIESACDRCVYLLLALKLELPWPAAAVDAIRGQLMDLCDALRELSDMGYFDTDELGEETAVYSALWSGLESHRYEQDFLKTIGVIKKIVGSLDRLRVVVSGRMRALCPMGTGEAHSDR